MQTLYQCDLSVIIPVYNLEEYIAPMIGSLMLQDLGGYKVEVIFVLNNCTDQSEQVIRNSGIVCTIIDCDKQGCGPARNAGYRIANGNYIWYMDGDDWLLTNTAIKTVLDKAYADDLDILRIPFASDLFRYMYFSMVWQYLIKREYVEEFIFPEYQPAEDDAYMLGVLSKAGYDTYSYLNMPHVNEALYYYNYMRDGSNMYRFAHGEKI